MEPQGGVSAEQAFGSMNAVTALVVTATGAEMRAAAYGIAQTVRNAHPSATHVLLEQSDQGDWLTLSGWHDVLAADQHDEVEVGWDDEVWSAPSHLYTAHIGFSPEGGTVPGLWCTDRRAGRYLLDVTQVLAEVTVAEPSSLCPKETP